MMVDGFKRPVLSLRISITSRCNLECIYCHNDGIIPQDYEMSADEIGKIARIAAEIGIKKIRLSGGEPLIRDDVVDIVRKISSVGFSDISLTTNGTLLGDYAKALVDAGLNRVNISFDTLDPKTYLFITKKNYLLRAKEGIKKAAGAGLYPIKVNMVIMNNINNHEIWDMFKFCRENGAILQLIELLKTNNCPDYETINKYHYEMDELEKKLVKISSKVKKRHFMQNRKKYFINGGEIEIVRPMDNTEFCKNCTRIRITPDGKIKPCLLRNDNLVNFIDSMRDGCSDDHLKNLFLEAIKKREPFYTTFDKG